MSNNRLDLILEKANEFVIKEWKYATPVGVPIVPVTGELGVTLNGAYSVNYSIVVKAMQIYNNSGTGTKVSLKQGFTVLWADYVAANNSLLVDFPNPIRLAANTTPDFIVETIGASIYVNAQGYLD